MTEQSFRLFLILACCAVVTSCGAIRARTEYDCSMSGERFHYRAGIRSGPQGAVDLRFTLVIDEWRNNYSVGSNTPIPEHESRQISLDRGRSSPSERVYLSDTVEPHSGIRVVSSLVLNTVSGDARIFHHKWLQPAGWEDSDQYSYVGNCRKLN